MLFPLALRRITCADLVVRTSYQVGKTPLLPLFAASLGAGELLVGAIVSVSTLTGMLLKPIFGWLSDSRGRKLWLLIGLALFSGVPFLYSLVDTPGQLFVLRLIHGLATAIYGPVTLAVVAEMAMTGRGERLGWFGMARTGSYLLAPLLAAWLLTWLQPSTVFTLIGFVSCLAFVPVLKMDLSSAPAVTAGRGHRYVLDSCKTACSAVLSSTGLWLASALELLVYIVTYSIKGFLPLYALYIADVNLLVVGLFFTVQEAAHLLMRPFGGRFGDKKGYLVAVNSGYLFLTVGVLLLPYVTTDIEFLLIAVLIGAGQGLIFPSTVALVSVAINARHLGAGMGMLGTVRNFGKVVGPVMAGVLITRLDYSQFFHITALMMLLAMLTILVVQKFRLGRIRMSLDAPSYTTLDL